MIVAREGIVEMRLTTLLHIRGLTTDVQNVVQDATQEPGTHLKIDATNYDSSMT